MFEFFRQSKQEEGGVAEKPDALVSEHLKEGVAPIRACIFNARSDEECKVFPNVREALDVNFYDSDDIMRLKELRNAGENTYVISPIDERSKLSGGYKNCTGVVVVGRSRDGGKELSFMSHEDPKNFLQNHKKSFIADLTKQLEEIKKAAEDETIDAVVFGGNYGDWGENSEYKKDYKDSVALLSETIEKELGFSPVVLTGPNIVGGDTGAYFDTAKRRLYILKPEEERATNLPYRAEDVPAEEAKWQKSKPVGSRRKFW